MALCFADVDIAARYEHLSAVLQPLSEFHPIHDDQAGTPEVDRRRELSKYPGRPCYVGQFCYQRALRAAVCRLADDHRFWPGHVVARQVQSEWVNHDPDSDSYDAVAGRGRRV